MRTGCRIALALLGGVMAWSAADHWVGSDDLRRHYAESALGPRGLAGVTVAQSLAAVGLLWPRFQSVAGLILATVMLMAAATHVRADGTGPGFWRSVAVGAWAAVPAVVLAWPGRSGAVSGWRGPAGGPQ